jgi:hypothetical protein
VSVAERTRAMLIANGLRAEVVHRDSQSVVWVPAQHYARAVDLMARRSESGPSPCDSCPEEADGRFDVCWTCEKR